MQTAIDEHLLPPHARAQADAALRKCVHCGFCNATCPTYQLTGNELDGPRGRIYLIKQALEGNAPTQVTQRHLDRCLTCTACESTCPSGVPYHTLLGIGRELVDEQVARPGSGGLKRKLIRTIASRTWLFRLAVWLGRRLRAVLPTALRAAVPTQGKPLRPSPEGAALRAETDAPTAVLLRGCVHPVLAPATHEAATRVLTRLGTKVISAREVGCCGALHHHFGDAKGARRRVQRNVSRLARLMDEKGVESIVTTASGCSAFMRDYPSLLADPHTGAIPAEAQRVADALRDIAQVLPPEALAALTTAEATSRRGPQLHCPCTLEHGLGLSSRVREVLQAVGLDAKADPHAGACCGSAGAWSVLEPEMAHRLGERRAGQLDADDPDLILSANVGCQQHLSRHTDTPVRHWIEEVEARTR
ncbi:MAG: glycolate oxidase subunit GlcF [Pseudomonadota bacterium]